MVRTRRVLRGHPRNFSLEKGSRELSPALKVLSNIPVSFLFHLGLVPPKDGSSLQARKYVPLSAHSGSEHGAGGLEDSGIKPHWILVVALGGGQDRDYIKDENAEAQRG